MAEVLLRQGIGKNFSKLTHDRAIKIGAENGAAKAVQKERP
jgi:hypothetical protein